MSDAAQDENGPKRNGPGVDQAPPRDHLVESRHTVTIGGEEIAYTVTAGTIVLKEEATRKGREGLEGASDGEKPKASFFFIAYTREDVGAPEERPVTFSFNGGPGSSSVWLHLGLLGPRRVLMDDEGMALPPPYRLVENEYSLLDQTDLVFIDPVSTGYSRVVPGEKAEEFHGFKKDLESVGDFIRLYVTRYHRWSSPKFLIGESYGTTRAAALAEYLQQRHGMYLNGVMLVSVVLNFQTLRFEVGNDLPYILYLPSYAATAWYHARLDDELQRRALRDLLDEVEAFALGDYTSALMRGAALDDVTRAEVVERVARYTGLTTDYVERTNLRINIHRFVKELLRDERRTVGRLDSRYIGFDRDAAGERVEHDPSMSAIQGPYTAVFYDYVRRDLGYESDLPYEILNFRVNESWQYGEHQNRYLNVAEMLRKAIALNPDLQVHVDNGYYDLATPYLATEYTINHLELDESVRANVSTSYYEAGHMMYMHLPSLARQKEVLAGFIDRSVPDREMGGR